VAEARGGIVEVEAADQELAGVVMPSALNVELDRGRGGRLGDLVRGPVGVPRLGMGWVVGEQIGVVS